MWMAIHFLKDCYIFHPNHGCSLHRLSINIYKCQNNKEGSKILLTFNMLTFNMLTFNMLTFNMLTFNMLTFNMLTFNMLTF
jgi:hypothetical protein